MATAAQVTKAILQEILVHGSESELEAVEFQDTVFTMNNYMTAQDASGIKLGYTVVTDLGDEITIPNGALQGLISNVAIMVAPQFGATVEQSLIAKAQMGLSAMRKLGVSQERMRFPSTLPRGSGNESNTTGREDHFFHDDQDSVLTETGNNISLETNT